MKAKEFQAPTDRKPQKDTKIRDSGSSIDLGEVEITNKKKVKTKALGDEFFSKFANNPKNQTLAKSAFNQNKKPKKEMSETKTKGRKLKEKPSATNSDCTIDKKAQNLEAAKESLHAKFKIKEKSEQKKKEEREAKEK